MAEFIEVARAKRRMCKAHTGKCSECKLQGNCSLLNVFAYNDNEVKKLENEVISWAAENPEPQYPTWAEWLLKVGAARRVPIGEPWPVELPDGSMLEPCYEIVVKENERIPADIAQKLGIEPKEG